MNQQFQLPRITAKDLEDASCSKINTIFDLLAKQIANSQGALGPIKFDTDITAKSVRMTRNTAPLPNDAVMYKELSALINVSIIDTHANRSAYPASLYKGKYYYENDRFYLYISDGTNWKYVAGVFRGYAQPIDLVVSDFGALFFDLFTTVQYYWDGYQWYYESGTMRGASRPTTLGTADTGFIFRNTSTSIVSMWDGANWLYESGEDGGALASIPTPTSTENGYIYNATDFGHKYVWSGAGWSFAPGDDGSQYIVAGGGTGGLWAACDGSVTSVATNTGTIGNVTTPDLTGNVFLQGDTSTSSVKVATRAAWETTAKTDDESTHTHTFNIGGIPTGGPTSATPPGTVVVQSGTGTTVASSDHFHNSLSEDHLVGPGAAHSHALSDTNAQLKKFDETNGGLPKRIALQWYMRR